eukprot:Gb_12092 [translate_table: standard]
MKSEAEKLCDCVPDKTVMRQRICNRPWRHCRCPQWGWPFGGSHEAVQGRQDVADPREATLQAARSRGRTSLWCRSGAAGAEGRTRPSCRPDERRPAISGGCKPTGGRGRGEGQQS